MKTLSTTICVINFYAIVIVLCTYGAVKAENETVALDYAKNQSLLDYNFNDTFNDQQQAKKVCSFRFHPRVQDFTQGWVAIDILNSRDKDMEFEHFFGCRSLTLVKHGQEKILIPAGKTGKVSLLLKTSASYAKKHPEKTDHECVFSTWAGAQKTDIKRCAVTINTLPGGTTFLKECVAYEKNSLDFHNVTTIKTGEGSQSGATFVTVMHYGANRTHYVANITCKPDINLIHHGNLYNSLKSNEIWKLPLFPNCSNVLDIDYSGKCRLSIYHLCQHKSKVMEYSFPYYEGNAEECIQPEETSLSLSAITRHSTIVTSFFVFISMVFTVCFTFTVKFVVMLVRHGSHDGPALFKDDVSSAFWFCCRRRNKNDYDA